MTAQMSTSKVLLLLAAGAAVAVIGAPTDAKGQTARPSNAAVTTTGPSEAVCTGAGRLLDNYIEGNASTFSAADRVQLRALVNWIGDGCRGTLTLGRTTHSIGATTFLQATLGRQYNFDNSIRFAGLDNGRRFAGSIYEAKYG